MRKSKLSRREVSSEEASAFAKNRGIGYIEVSAKESKNVDQAFVMVAESILGKIESRAIDPKNEVR